MPIPATLALSNPAAGVTVDRLIFGWWNTSLSPVGIVRADDEHKEMSSGIVKMLIDDMGVDCLALGEVTNADLSFLKDLCETEGLSLHDGMLKTGRLQFDTGIIYNKNRLAITDSYSFTNSHGDRNYKVANAIEFVSPAGGPPVHLFVSHWPSRGQREENILVRKKIADWLKEKLLALEEISPGASVMVMGDFNDEPFDESIAWNLLATRDRDLAQTKRGYLYNPFWRRLGQSQAYSHAVRANGAAGSCFYRGESGTRWRTFDQILFSSAFLGNGDWHLNEEATIIVENEDMVNLIQDNAVHFDHLPILSMIEKITQNK